MRRVFAALVLLVAGVAALDRAFPPDLSRADSLSAEVTDRDGAALAVFPAPGGVWRLRTTVEDVPPAFVAMLGVFYLMVAKPGSWQQLWPW